MAAPILPLNFPELPNPPDGELHWSANVCSAHSILSETYDRATQLLRQEDGDALRLRIHSERIFHRMVPILEAMEPEVRNFDWTSECAHALAGVMAQLETAGFAADGVFVHSSLVLKTEAHT
jgi:hypothetical protein